MAIPQIKAEAGGVWREPGSTADTYLSVNVGTTDNPDYQWKRNPTYSVLREFTPTDEARLINTEYLATKADEEVFRGTWEQVTNNYKAMFLVVDDPNLLLNAKFGGPYVQIKNNLFKLEQFGIDLDTGDPLDPVDPVDPTYPVDPNNPVIGPVEVGDFGVQISGNTIIFPRNSYYQVQDYKTPQNTLYEGMAEDTNVPYKFTVADGVYKIIDLTRSEVTRNVSVPQEPTPPVINPDTYTKIGNFGFEVSGIKIRLTESDYYQIQNTNGFTTVFEGNGPHSETLPEGTYKIIKLTAPVQTIEGLVLPYDGNSGSVTDNDGGNTVTIGSMGLTLTGNTFNMTRDNFYQIQNAAFVDIFKGQGPTSFTVPNGVYKITNVSTGEKARDIQVPQP